MRIPGQAHDLGGDAARLELVHLLQEDLRIDDATGSEHGDLAGDHAARNLADLERLAVDNDRVPGVRPALVAADQVRMLRQQVDDLPLPLVPPLRADYHRAWHVNEH